MKDRVHKHFDPYCEVFGLLMNSLDFEKDKENIIKEMDALGVSGKNLYDLHFKPFEKAILAFSKELVIDADYSFFFSNVSEDAEFVMFLLVLLAEYLEVIKSESVTNSRLQTLILEVQAFLAEQETKENMTLTEFIEYVTTLTYGDAGKWKLVTIYQNPVLYLNTLVTLIEHYIPVYEKVYQSIDMTVLINRYYDTLTNNKATVIAGINTNITKDIEYYPSLMLPLSTLIIANKGYYGLINQDIFSNYNQPLDDSLLISLKALSDKSKLQILLSLKKKPKYSLELAEELGLSAGTISHHMGVLLATNLVNVEKVSGKVYYQLDTEGVQAVIIKLNSILFD